MIRQLLVMRRLATVLALVIIGCFGTFFFEGNATAASIILKMQVSNPSKTESQTVPVKVYLPKEVSPNDIIDSGNLKLDYDPDTGMYYVHQSVDLKPGQSIIKAVEMKDVWVFTEEQLTSFVQQAKEVAKELEGTPYATEAQALIVGIEEKVQGILKRQEETAEQPSEHIRAYRQGIALMNTIRQDVLALEQLRLDIGGGKDSNEPKVASLDPDSRLAFPGPEGLSEEGAPLGRSISMTAAWRIIFAILIFLGILSFIFFMTWHRLLRTHMESEQKAGPLPTGNPLDEGSEGLSAHRTE